MINRDLNGLKRAGSRPPKRRVGHGLVAQLDHIARAILHLLLSQDGLKRGVQVDADVLQPRDMLNGLCALVYR